MLQIYAFLRLTNTILGSFKLLLNNQGANSFQYISFENQEYQEFELA